MRILLGVCGGIAAYKAAGLASTLVQRGDRLDVIMTDDAARFIAPLTFSALTRRPVYGSLWDAPESIPHIALVRDNDVMLIAPATANAIAKLANGIADDLLTNAALAARIPLVIAPAMNDAMFEHPATQANLARLHERGCTIVGPAIGFLAEREVGIGRLAEPDAIVAALDAVVGRARDLAGTRVLVTAGPTREPIDPVRFLSNASTGTMGIELAREALARGASVELVLGPTLIEPPPAARVTRVTTAQQMYDAVMAVADEADVAIGAAAVCDWRPVEVHPQKVKKGKVDPKIGLERTPDILQTLGERRSAGSNGRQPFVVGFAAETERLEENAREKMRLKALDAIAVNDVGSAHGGFGVGASTLALLWGSAGRRDLGTGSKRELAQRLWDALIDLRNSSQ